MALIDKAVLKNEVKNKTVLITGGSSGIGESTAYLLASAGAHVILLARSYDKLVLVKDKIEQSAGKVSIYSCDLTDTLDVSRTAKKIMDTHHTIDILVNNAGRSIRRSVRESIARFHDFERTMNINYFGAVRLTLEVLPNMLEKKAGHIINISSIGVLANSPRFSAYVASKAALDAFSRCLATEVKAQNVLVSTIYMPLVRTPMIAPTKLYKYMPALSTEDAAMLIAKAIIEKPPSIASNMGKLASATYTLIPSFGLAVQSFGFRLFPGTKAAQTKDKKPNLLQRAFAKVLPGEH